MDAMMTINELWKSKEVKNLHLKIIQPLDNDRVAVTFETAKLNPKRLHIWHKAYLEFYYEPTGVVQNWQFE